MRSRSIPINSHQPLQGARVRGVPAWPLWTAQSSKRHRQLVTVNADKRNRVQEELDEDLRRRISRENELRDPANFLEYFLPRPIRLVFFGGSALSCGVSTAFALARLLAQAAAPDPLLVPEAPAGVDGAATDVVVNLIGLAVFAGLFFWDRRQQEERIERRRVVREKQIEFGDREVFRNADGERMSRLKEVDDEWILRRLERWGRRDGMPFLGPAKAKLLQRVVGLKRPRVVVEVGSMAGYSAICIAQALPQGSKLVSIEKDVSWWLAAKRFLWQASQGSRAKAGEKEAVCNKVDVWLGDASDPSKLSEVVSRLGKIDMLFLDGVPKETLSYLEAALPHLAPGCVVVADNAGVFAEGGMKPYLERVRGGGDWSSGSIASTLEWRDDVPDAMEVSVYKGQGGPGEAAALAEAAAGAAAAVPRSEQGAASSNGAAAEGVQAGASS